MMEPFDAVVIGGGPAGSIAAMLLVRLGWRTALVERRSTAIGKTCGHCLSSRALPMLASIGLDGIVQQVAAGRTQTMSAYASSSFFPCATVAAPAIITPRDQLDHRLIDEARARGVTVYQPASARVISQGTGMARPGRLHDIRLGPAIGNGQSAMGNRIVAECRMPNPDCRLEHLRARLVVGADGLRSRVAQSCNLLGRQQPGRKFGFSLGVSGSSFLQSPGMATSGISHGIHMFITGKGYLGIVRERGDRFHCAALVQRPNESASRDPRSFIDAMAESFPQLHGLRNTACERGDILAAGPMPYRPARVADCGVALIGDAAGYVEPFTGEGMTWAIESAIALAEVCESNKPGHFTGREAARYASLYHAGIARRQRLCWLISLALERPWLLRSAFSFETVSTFLGRHVAARLQAA